jgi:hypothetical protein
VAKVLLHIAVIAHVTAITYTIHSSLHLRKPSVRFSLTLADFNATEMPSIGMSIEPTGVLISQKKKSCTQWVLNRGPFRLLDLLSNQFGHGSSLNDDVF